MNWYDLSPMRPDEFMRQDAERWIEANTLQQAIRDGTADARSERTANEQLQRQEWPDDQE